MHPFWLRKYREIRENGWDAVISLIKYIIAVRSWVPGIILCMPLVIIIRMIRPIIWFRFGNINAGRIGHFTYDVEYYLAEKEIGMHAGTRDIFFFGREPANSHFAKMCSRKLVIKSFARHLWRANDIIPGGNKHVVIMSTRKNDYRDELGLFNKTQPHLPFTSEENEQGRQFLRHLGCGPRSKFVCLIVRDSAYMARYHGDGYSYHDYRDSDIDSFKEAALALAEKGYWLFRMGKAVHKPFKIDHPRILDYANSHYRSDLLDIWLMGNCYFCISTSTGLDAISIIYRRPAAYVNFDIFNQMVLYQQSVVVPKHYYWKNGGRHLTFKECIEHSYTTSKEYLEAGIDIKNLSEEEITEAVLELEARLNGTWVGRWGDEELQGRFLDLYKASPEFAKYHGWIHPEFRVGTQFLRNHQQLLEDSRNPLW